MPKNTKQADLFQTIRTLVPGLDEEQYTQLEAILALAGIGGVEPPAELPEPPVGDEEMLPEDAMAKSVRKALRTMGLDPDEMIDGSVMSPRRVSRKAANPPPYEFKDNGGNDDQRLDAVKATYQIRYGTPDSAVKAVLTDLYGKDFEAVRWNQWKAFNRFLRRPDTQPDAADMKLLRTVVITPDLAAKAIQMGIEVSALKDTMIESVDSLGGVVVPVDFQMRVIERLQGMVIMRGRASVESTSRDKIEFPVAKGGDNQYTSAVRVTWVDETPTAGAGATNLTFGLESIPVHTVMAETPLSRNLIEDAAFDLAGYLSRKFAEASAIDEDNKFLTGDGNGKPQGILPSSANSLSLTEVVSGDANTITWDGLINLSFGPASQYRGNAIWMGEKATYATIATLKNGLGDYLWRRDQTQGQPTTLMGYATAEQEALPTIAASAYPLIFGDPSGYTIVDRVGATIERYLDSATARQNMVYYVMRRRLGGQVTEPWKFAVQKIAAS